jgi:molybdopterin synthase catalytic subunit
VIDITEKDFSIEELMQRAGGEDVGAVVAFLGTVRDDGIQTLELESYKEAALAELEAIEREAMSRFNLKSVEIVHRIGPLSVGEKIALIVCGAPHRKEAFEGCSYILEELKSRAPFWKKEIREDGERWVGMRPSF